MLELKHIDKSFNLTGKKEDTNVVLKDLNLTIEEGEFVVVIGSNGSGKSTTMNIITGSLIPEKGQVILDGEDITKKKEYQRAKYFGRVFQDPKMGTSADMSVIENLEIAYKRGERHSPLTWGFKKEHKEIFIDELKRFDLGLEDRLNQKVGCMSGGQRQALTLLMATLQKPKVLLLDEHTAALDPKTAKKVLELTEKIIKENHLTAIMVTHNMKDAIKYGDRLVMFHSRKIIYDVKGEEKAKLSAHDLMEMFENAEKEEENE